ncbi:MAG: hypothetical protein ABEI52_05920 [Halobacteriaceae archaeon]
MTDEAGDQDLAELRAELELLSEENRRLRQEYARAKKTEYRRTAAGLFLVGVLSSVGAALFSDLRDVLLALGAIGVFSGILVVYLTPERVVPADAVVRFATSWSETLSALVAQLGLSDERLYIPASGTSIVHLFIPAASEHQIPPPDQLKEPIVVGDDPSEHGLSIHPSGAPLYHEFRRSFVRSVADDARPLADQISEAIVEGFELARNVETEVSTTDSQMTARVRGDVIGETLLDHPAASIFGVGMADVLDQPIRVTTTTGDDDELIISCTWGLEE